MGILTISRQLGAGGGAVADAVAEALNWRLLDRALVERIAQELEVAPAQVEVHDERVETFVERLGQYLSEGFPEGLPVRVVPPLSPEVTARAARSVVEAVVEEGPAVIVGHGAQCILQDHPRAVHVLLHAAPAIRTARAAERYGIGSGEAAERVRRLDRQREAYVREHFAREWLDPTLYHLAVDTGRLPGQLVVDLIVRTIRSLGF
jgi:hypothetical protein